MAKEATPQDLHNIAQGVASVADDVSPVSTPALDAKLQAISQGVLDNGNDPKPEAEAVNEEDLKARIEAAKAYEKYSNELVAKREEAAELQKKTDDSVLERRALEEKLAAAEEYEKYSNSFVVAQNENKVDPTVRDYELKEAFLSDREAPIEHRFAEGIEKVAHEDAVNATPTDSQVKAGQRRALEQADKNLEIAKDAAKKG